MTDRINALTVVLDKHYRDDDVRAVIKAIMMIKGVIAVDKNVVEMETYAAETRARNEIRKKILDILYPEDKR